MAKSKANTETRSLSVDVTDSKAASALIAAWRGIVHFFGGQVENWVVVEPSNELPDGGLIAYGFTVNSQYDPNRILEDITVRDRRVPLFPAYTYLTDSQATPPDFTDPKEMTAWSTQFLRGSVEEGTARTPEYAKTAIANYKSGHGMATRRGRQRKIFRIDEFDTLDEATLRKIDPAQLSAFLARAQSVVDSTETVENAGDTNSAEANSMEPATV